jgi:two-component system response regulator GlrR
MAKKKVLIIDDEPDFIRVIKERIESWGFDVSSCEGGIEALEALKKMQPDAIVLDYIMPEMDGVEVLKRIRAQDPKIPVIMFTAHPDIKVIKGADALGVSAFIPKFSAYTDVQNSLKAALDLIDKASGDKKG